MDVAQAQVQATEPSGSDKEQQLSDFDNHIESGFQIATFQGPLCGEPVQGMAFFVEALQVDSARVDEEGCKSWSLSYWQFRCMLKISFSSESHDASDRVFALVR